MTELSDFEVLAHLDAVIDALMLVEPDMPISRVKVLTALMRKEGLNGHEIMARTGMDVSKINRDLQALGERNRMGNPGAGLIYARPSDHNASALQRFWTPKGQAWKQRFLDILQRRTV